MLAKRWVSVSQRIFKTMCNVYFSLNVWGIVDTKVISLENILNAWSIVHNAFNFIYNALNFIHNAWKTHINANFLKPGFRKEGQIWRCKNRTETNRYNKSLWEKEIMTRLDNLTKMIRY